MKLKQIVWVIVVLLVVFMLYIFLRPSGQEMTEDIQTIDPVNNNDSEPVENVIEEVPNALQGELQISNDRRRGNLMLLMNDSDRIIYLNTSRDYSSLLGKQVQVTIEGSLDDFRLVEITEQ